MTIKDYTSSELRNPNSKQIFMILALSEIMDDFIPICRQDGDIFIGVSVRQRANPPTGVIFAVKKNLNTLDKIFANQRCIS
jgi:hypothetical protein